VAACGGTVLSVAGRGLGHTGGTVDKLEAIPGLRMRRSASETLRQVRQIGVAIVGQSGEIAPADGRIYALRDMTATVESEPLIVGSILSKKIAEGARALVLDVKVGNGAFCRTPREARSLAQALIRTGRAAGLHVVALLTDMSQPLGEAVGNACEVAEAIEILRGGGPADVRELVVRLGGEMLALSHVTRTVRQGRHLIARALGNRSGVAVFRQMVIAQGGDVKTVDDPSRLPHARHRRVVRAKQSGFLAAVDTRAIGNAAIELGAGRRSREDRVDPGAGLLVRIKIGDSVQKGDVLAVLLTNQRRALAGSAKRVLAAFTISGRPTGPKPLILANLGFREQN